jgi:WD40 repeat protein
MQQRMGGVNALVVSRDLACIMSVGQDRKLVFWANERLENKATLSDTPGVLKQQYIDGEEDEGMAIALSGCGGFIATGGTAGVVRLWTYPGGVMVSAGRGHNTTITSLAFSPGDRQLVTGAVDGCIIAWYLDLTSSANNTMQR